jgi:hypothetical protein
MIYEYNLYKKQHTRFIKQHNRYKFTEFLDEDLETIPPFISGVTHRSLRDDQGLQQRANAFGRGLSRPANHRQASGGVPVGKVHVQKRSPAAGGLGNHESCDE